MGVKLKQFKYILLPIIPISIAKVILFYFVSQQITHLSLNYWQYFQFPDNSLSQLAKNNADHITLTYDYSYLDAVKQLQSLCETIAISNFQFNPQEEQSQPLIQTYASNLLSVVAGTETPSGFSSSTNQSIQSFLWYATSGVTDVNSLTDTQKTQLNNYYLRAFKVLRPFYVSRQKWIDYIIIYSKQTNMYLRYPARKTNLSFTIKSTSTSTFDFSQTAIYDTAQAQFSSDSQKILLANPDQGYSCGILRINLGGCQNAFCGLVCVFYVNTPSSTAYKDNISLWYSLSQKINQSIDKLFVIEKDSAIQKTSEAVSSTSSSELLPLSVEIKEIIKAKSLQTLSINQCEKAWINCGTLSLSYSSASSVGVIATCSLSSKFQLKKILDNIEISSFSPLFIYLFLIYIGMYLCAWMLIYQTSISFITPVKKVQFKINQLINGTFDIDVLSLGNHQIEEIKNLCIALHKLFDCIRFSDDRYYQNEEDSVVLIRLCGALKHFNSINYERGIGIVCNNMGQVHIQNQRYKEAIKYYKQSLKIVEERINDLVGKEDNLGIEMKTLQKKIQEEEEEEMKEGEIDLDGIPEKILKNNVFDSITNFITDRKIQQTQKRKKSLLFLQQCFQSLSPHQLQQQVNSANSSRVKNQPPNTLQPSSQLLQPPQLISQSQSFRSSLSNTQNGQNDTSILKSITAKKKFNMFIKQMQKQFIKLQKENISHEPKQSKNAISMKKLEPLFINRCFQIANAYCIYAFDMKKTSRKQAKKIADKAIDKFTLLVQKFENNPSNNRRHIMVLIRLNLLYLECADYNMYVAKNKESQSKKDFNKAYEAYEKATEMLAEYKNKLKPEDREKDMMNQVSDFYNFLFLKGAGLYQNAFQCFFESLTQYKYYDPALRYSYLTHIKQILDHFNIETPQSLLDLMQGFDQRKNKDLVFVLDLTKTTKLNKSKDRCVQIFKKIYQKYIDKEDRVAYIRFDESVKVVFELKNKHYNEIYFKKFIDQDPDPKGDPSTLLLCRAVYEGTKLFQKVEGRNNSKWIVLITDNLRNSYLNYCHDLSHSFQTQQDKQREDLIHKLKTYLQKQPQPINIMVIGIRLSQEMKSLYKDLCQATHEGIFIEDGNNDDIDIALESISNVQHLYGGAAGSTGVTIQDFQKESFQNRTINEFDIQEEDEEI